MQKKASLELSINAIVILVLAITMLGLGLGFTKGMFGQLKSQLVVPPPEIPATSDDPIVLPSGGELQIKAAKDAVFTVNYFNNVAGDTFTPDIKCDTTYLNPTVGEKNLIVSSQRVEAQTYKGFQMIIKADTFSATGGIPLGYTICTIEFYGSASTSIPVQSKQIIINAQ
jgi:hypothetical protein